MPRQSVSAAFKLCCGYGRCHAQLSSNLPRRANKLGRPEAMQHPGYGDTFDEPGA